MRLIRHPLAAVLASALVASCSAPHEDASTTTTKAAAPAASYQKIADGVIVPVDGSKEKVRLRLVSPTIVHVTAAADGNFNLPASLMAVKIGGGDQFKVDANHDHVQLKTDRLTADVDPHTGSVQFLKPDGTVILAEKPDGRSFTPVQVQGKPFYAVTQRFASPDDEAFYGLGQHQNAQMNLNGEDVELAQHNMDVGVPFVVSTPQLRRAVGQQLHHALRRSEAVRTRSRASQAVRRRRQAGRLHRALLRRRQAEARRASRRTSTTSTSATASAGRRICDRQGVTGRQPRTRRWSGRARWSPTSAGDHKFQLYGSSYFKVFVDGKLVLDRWRQNWNAWYHNFERADGRPASRA